MNKELQDAFRHLRNNRAGASFVAKVVGVDKQNGICTVEADDLEYAEVRLSSVVNNRENVFYLFPVPGSSVIVAPIYNDIHNLFVVSYSEVEDLKLNIENTNFEVTPEGFTLKRENESMRNLLDDLKNDLADVCDYIKQTATKAGAAAVIPLATAKKTKFETELKKRIKTLFKED